MQTIGIRHIFISPDHGFIGREGDDDQAHPMQSVDSIDCVAGKGLKGDRFFQYKANYKGQVTFFSEEVLKGVFDHVGAMHLPLWSMRRNIMVSGVDLNSLIGREFRIDGVKFYGTEECAPCRWMDRAIGEGARSFLKNRGGLRARILSDGTLHIGETGLYVESAA